MTGGAEGPKAHTSVLRDDNPRRGRRDTSSDVFTPSVIIILFQRCRVLIDVYMDRCRLLYAWSGASSALNVLHRINSIDTIDTINTI